MAAPHLQIRYFKELQYICTSSSLNILSGYDVVVLFQVIVSEIRAVLFETFLINLFAGAESVNSSSPFSVLVEIYSAHRDLNRD